MELGRLFHSLGDAEHARQFSERAERLRQLGTLVDEVYKDPQNPQLMHRAAELCEVLGRLWEARAWPQTALQLDPNLPWARQAIHRWHASLGEGLDAMRESCPAFGIELTSFPLPDWSSIGVRRRRLVNLTRRFPAGRRSTTCAARPA